MTIRERMDAVIAAALRKPPPRCTHLSGKLDLWCPVLDDELRILCRRCAEVAAREATCAHCSTPLARFDLWLALVYNFERYGASHLADLFFAGLCAQCADLMPPPLTYPVEVDFVDGTVFMVYQRRTELREVGQLPSSLYTDKQRDELDRATSRND